MAAPELNPYATPQARIEEAQPLPAGAAAFFPVTRLKLAVMSLTTFGLYLVYWFYKNWKASEALGDPHVNAPIRAFFYPLVAYGLFARIRRHAKPAGGVELFAAGPLALALLLLSVLWRLPDPYGLIVLLNFLPVLPVQATVNELNAKLAPGVDPNGRFQGWNYVALIGGGLLLVLAVTGTFIGDQQ